jgi:hypothetical protein
MPSRIDDTTGVATVRAWRGSDGVCGPAGERAEVTTPGRDDTQPARPRDLGQACRRRVDAVTATLVAGHHPPRRVSMGCLSVRGLTLAHAPIATERARQPPDVQPMTGPWHSGLGATPPSPTVSHAVACAQGSAWGHAWLAL